MHLAALPRAKPDCCCPAWQALDISSLSCVTDCCEVERCVLTIIKRIIIIIIINQSRWCARALTLMPATTYIILLSSLYLCDDVQWFFYYWSNQSINQSFNFLKHRSTLNTNTRILVNHSNQPRHAKRTVLFYLSNQRQVFQLPFLIQRAKPNKSKLPDDLHSLSTAMASPAMGHVARAPPRLPTISFLVHFGINLTTNYPTIVSSAISAGAEKYRGPWSVTQLLVI